MDEKLLRKKLQTALNKYFAKLTKFSQDQTKRNEWENYFGIISEEFCDILHAFKNNNLCHLCPFYVAEQKWLTPCQSIPDLALVASLAKGQKNLDDDIERLIRYVKKQVVKNGFKIKE
ncbi:MAG: hypothetical protein WC940_02920 [Candidatus Paceibacterota bacterium]|jgi:hypothetical protein